MCSLHSFFGLQIHSLYPSFVDVKVKPNVKFSFFKHILTPQNCYLVIDFLPNCVQFKYETVTNFIYEGIELVYIYIEKFECSVTLLMVNYRV